MATHKTLKSPLKKSPLRSPSKIKYIKQQSVNSGQNLYEIVADNEEQGEEAFLSQGTGGMASCPQIQRINFS